MPCYRPLYGWQGPGGGALQWGAERPNTRQVEIPCGYCTGCRIKRARSWAIRCVHELQTNNGVGSFITLTYDQNNYKPGLEYPDFQAFMRQIRKSVSGVRYFCAGEYGETTKRPHFHALLFGLQFENLQECGTNLYRSRELEEIWTKGFSSIGQITPASAGYVAQYSVKKVYGKAAATHYQRVHLATGEIVQIKPEMAHMSLKPGIGYEWFKKHWKEAALARDGVVTHNGKAEPLPRYYFKMLDEISGEIKDWREYTRYIESGKLIHDSTIERLAVREEVEKARLRMKGRKL